MEYFVAITAVILIIFFVSYLQRGQKKIKCPHCQSSQIRKIDEQLNKLTQDRTTGLVIKGDHYFGKKLDVQLIMETKYRCQHCNHTWTVTAAEQ